ncbi:30S ribosomal protein S8, partial [Staphylococcus epidermidis]|uniref:30S ribosomal protein S8 n=1 Tax=Staphylococcus epidermidis TaxID=1282 RepID=UPI0037DA025A
MLTPLTNPNMLPHHKLQLPASNIKKQIPQILNTQAFIKNVQYVQDHKQRLIPFF